MTPKSVRRRVARNIRRIAAEQDMSLNRVSVVSGVTRSAFYSALYGKTSMTIDTATKVAKALTVDVAELFVVSE